MGRGPLLDSTSLVHELKQREWSFIFIFWSPFIFANLDGLVAGFGSSRDAGVGHLSQLAAASWAVLLGAWLHLSTGSAVGGLCS